MNFRPRILVPLVMTALFMVGWVRAELAWRACSPDGPCFDYPAYLPYEIHQIINLHWPALLAVTLLDVIPESLGGGRGRSGSVEFASYVVTLLSVVGFWFAIGVWWERLSAGQSPLAGRARILALATIAIAVPLTMLALSLGMRGGFEGPVMTDAGLAAPLLLALMGLVHTHYLPEALHRRTLRAVVSAMLLVMYVWADFEYLGALSDYERGAQCDGTSTSLCFAFPMETSPMIQDAISLQWPVAGPLLIGSSGFLGTPIVRLLRYAVVWGYWYVLLSMAVGQLSANRLLRVIRVPLRAIGMTLLILSAMLWMFSTPHHGPTPMFALAVGSGIFVYALRPHEAAGSG